jgi:hypothetical protein
VLLNAAFALSTECGDLPAGLEEARASIDSGAALRVLESYIADDASFLERVKPFQIRSCTRWTDHR